MVRTEIKGCRQKRHVKRLEDVLYLSNSQPENVIFDQPDSHYSLDKTEPCLQVNVENFVTFPEHSADVTHIEIIKPKQSASRRLTGANRVLPFITNMWQGGEQQVTEPTLAATYKAFFESLEFMDERKCEECQLELLSSTHLQYHLKEVHKRRTVLLEQVDTIPRPYSCTKCHRKFMHKKTFHRDHFIARSGRLIVSRVINNRLYRLVRECQFTIFTKQKNPDSSTYIILDPYVYYPDYFFLHEKTFSEPVRLIPETHLKYIHRIPSSKILDSDVRAKVSPNSGMLLEQLSQQKEVCGLHSVTEINSQHSSTKRGAYRPKNTGTEETCWDEVIQHLSIADYHKGVMGQGNR
uniref:C2H2-type domain-containing protein n=1 Tax=Timema monikensis TaxID=170555 RepID=A0A7R9E922_9NEOP|nr:unnamed protein product [Timema monikensis]